MSIARVANKSPAAADPAAIPPCPTATRLAAPATVARRTTPCNTPCPVCGPIQATNRRPNRPAPPNTPVPDTRRRIQPHLPGYWAWELAELELDGLSPDLRQEVQTVRVVILRLLRLWDNPAQPLAPEEARRLATLIFSGARTVAHLLSRQTGRKPTRPTGWPRRWRQWGSKYGLDL